MRNHEKATKNASENTTGDSSGVDESPANPGRASERTRTADPFITSEVLYQLSYGGEAGGED